MGKAGKTSNHHPRQLRRTTYILYAQCEDDLKRVVVNYYEKLGWLSKEKGELQLQSDLLNRIIIDQDAAKADYKKAPAWLKKLCDAFADAVNYYVYKHTEASSILVSHAMDRWQHWCYQPGRCISF